MTLDQQQSKDMQRQQWEAAASGWEKWWSTIEKGGQHISDRMVELAGLQPGNRVLDIASGIGEPAVTAARRVSPAGRVVATDLSDAMLAIAKKRARSLGISNIDYQTVDGETLNFPENSFDAALCRFGLMLFPNPMATLEQGRRVLTPGGTFVSAVWGLPPEVPMGSVIFGVMQKMLELPPPPPGSPGLFSLGAPNLLEEKFEQAGYVDIQSESLTLALVWPSAESYAEMMRDTAPAITGAISRQPAAQQQEIWQAIQEATQQYAVEDGSIHMENKAICVSGRKPVD